MSDKAVSVKERIRARDPYYRITGRDPAADVPLTVSVITVASVVVATRLLGHVWATAVVLIGVLLLAECAARLVERRRAIPPR